MAKPTPAVAIPKEIQHSHIALQTKPSAQISYTCVPGSGDIPRRTLIVFLNGLGLAKSFWIPIMASVLQERKTAGCPPMLAYDRYGQGSTTDSDPSDEGENSGHGHDVTDVVTDLRQLVTQIAYEKSAEKEGHVDNLELVFVCNSIGCAIARVYAKTYPRTVSGLLFLDSIMANSDFTSIWPDPDITDFDASSLAEGVTPELCRETRGIYGKIFHPSVPNQENLSRKNLAQLLPHSDAPEIIGPREGTPLVTVVGHDPEYFAEDSLLKLRTPKVMSMHYTNPYWHRYNEGLTKITASPLAKGPVIAKGCGHFIQKDDPGFVAAEICEMLSRLE
ncbi:MAG: hypothetical protein M1812_003377 [Candelaria pacifica]|nr:MAG: hypothetical protein M1812_003377 [Candelaria pacifica]